MSDEMNKLKPFNPDTYEQVDLDRLVVFTMVKLDDLGIDLSLENIIVGAFRLFPKKFSLLGYPEFPDATRIEKSLWRSKGKRRQWIGGKTPHGYMVNDRTGRIAEQVRLQLASPPMGRRKTASRTRRKESILRDVTNSPAYSKYTDGKLESISDAEVCYLLQGTLDSSRETLRENLGSIRRFAEELGHRELLQFLDWLSQRFEGLLHGK